MAADKKTSNHKHEGSADSVDSEKREALKKKLNGRVGIALGGGGALGIAHIGVLKAFKERGIEPAVMSGNSAGAMIGGMYCAGLSIEAMTEVARSVDAKKSAVLFRPTLAKGGLIDGKAVKKFLHDIVGDVRIEDLLIPFITSTVDLNSGDLLYIQKGLLVDAMMASISVPGAFVPYRANGMLLVDGGVRNTIPLGGLEPYEPDMVIGVHIVKKAGMDRGLKFIDIVSDEETEEQKASKNLIDYLQGSHLLERLFPNKDVPVSTKIIIEAVSILLTQSGFRELEIAKPDIQLEIDSTVIKPWEFSRGREVIETGYQQAKEQLDAYLGSGG